MKADELKYGECIHHENIAQCEVCNTNWNPEVPMPTIEGLLSLLALHGGKIVSTASLTIGFINQARFSGRLHVDVNGFGYVWEPEINGLPESEEEVEFFEKWYPLNVPIPEDINTWEKVQERAKKPKPERDN